MALEKYLKITLFLLNMKYQRNIWMLDNDFLAAVMLIRTNLDGVYLRKCLIFYNYVFFDQFILERNIHFQVKMS